LGSLRICAQEEGITYLAFIEAPEEEARLQKIVQREGVILQEGENRHIQQACEELEAYFAGTRKSFDCQLCFYGSHFQQRVWHSLLDIPYGTTHSYARQALALGNPDAIRAVAAANGQNLIAILVPCHRIIGSNGQLTGYRGGLERKKYLLDLEQKPLQQYLLDFG